MYHTDITAYIHKIKIHKCEKNSLVRLTRLTCLPFFKSLEFFFLFPFYFCCLLRQVLSRGQGRGASCVYMCPDTYTHANLRDRCQLLLLHDASVGKESTGLTNRSPGRYHRGRNLPNSEAGKAHKEDRGTSEGNISRNTKKLNKIK